MEIHEVARAGAYALLARLMRGPPDGSLLRSLADMSIPDEGESNLGDAWRTFIALSATVNEQDVYDEFMEIFLGVEAAQVYPYGSVHQSGYFMGSSLAGLRTDLSRLGLAPRSTVHEPEDHIAALCEAMRFMLSDGCNGASTSLETQAQFFRSHIAPWYGAFTDQLERAPSANYYRSVARFARAFFDVESSSFAPLEAGEFDVAAETEP